MRWKGERAMFFRVVLTAIQVTHCRVAIADKQRLPKQKNGEHALVKSEEITEHP